MICRVPESGFRRFDLTSSGIPVIDPSARAFLKAQDRRTIIFVGQISHHIKSLVPLERLRQKLHFLIRFDSLILRISSAES